MKTKRVKKFEKFLFRYTNSIQIYQFMSTVQLNNLFLTNDNKICFLLLPMNNITN